MDGLDGTKPIGSEEATIPSCGAVHGIRYLPLLGNGAARTIIGFILLGVSAIFAGTVFDQGCIGVLALIAAMAWALTVFLTEKYVHKYPQRYYAYFAASHPKAAIVMAASLWIMGFIAVCAAPANDALWTAYGVFIASDALVSIPRRRDTAERPHSVAYRPPGATDSAEKVPADSHSINKEAHPGDQEVLFGQMRAL